MLGHIFGVGKQGTSNEKFVISYHQFASCINLYFILSFFLTLHGPEFISIYILQSWVALAKLQV